METRNQVREERTDSIGGEGEGKVSQQARWLLPPVITLTLSTETVGRDPTLGPAEQTEIQAGDTMGFICWTIQ